MFTVPIVELHVTVNSIKLLSVVRNVSKANLCRRQKYNVRKFSFKMSDILPLLFKTCNLSKDFRHCNPFQISRKFSRVEAELIHSDRRTDGWTYMKLIGASDEYAKAQKSTKIFKFNFVCHSVPY